MSGPQFMPFYIGDYLRDTQHLHGAEQHGAYLLLLMACWTYGSLPDDDRKLADIAQLSRRKWSKFRTNFDSFFAKKSDGLWHQKRVDLELQHAEKVREARSKAGIKSAAKRQQKFNSRAGVTSTATATIDSEEAGASSALGEPRASARDPVKEIFERGVAILGGKHRSLLGKARKQFGDVAVLRAITQTEAEQPSEPVGYFLACCERHRLGNGQKLSAATKMLIGGQRAVERILACQADRNPGDADDADVPLLDRRRDD